MARITPNLWFDDNGLEAAEYYVSVFPNSRVTNVLRYSEAGPCEPGSIVTVDFELDGEAYTVINGGPMFTFNEAVSLCVNCKDQDEVDYYWDKLTDGGEEGQCGWLKDRYGVSWQVFPTQLMDLLADPDPNRAARATEAMYAQQKIDIAAIEKAAAGT